VTYGPGCAALANGDKNKNKESSCETGVHQCTAQETTHDVVEFLQT